jgi:putative membrane protein
MKSLLHEREKKIIQETIDEVEKHTSGEIVVKVARNSNFYLWIYPLMILAGVLVGSGIFLLVAWNQHWDPPAGQLLLSQILGALVGVALSAIPGFRRSLIAQEMFSHAVHREALANFMDLGMSHTRGRTGILIYISEFEHRVEILADKGINSKVTPDYWAKEVDDIIKGIRANAAARAIVSAVTDIGAKLAEHFPPAPNDNPNELSNELR